MKIKDSDNNGNVRFDGISSEEDLLPNTRIIFNPPPRDGRCECCGRHISELKPYVITDDPLLGDFYGALLVKTWRPAELVDRDADAAWDEAMKYFAVIGDKDRDPLEWMIQKYGKEKGESLFSRCRPDCQIDPSWECRDCIILDDYEYCEIYFNYTSKES